MGRDLDVSLGAGRIDVHVMGKNGELILTGNVKLDFRGDRSTYNMLMEQFMNQREEQRTCMDPVDTKVLINL